MPNIDNKDKNKKLSSCDDKVETKKVNKNKKTVQKSDSSNDEEDEIKLSFETKFADNKKNNKINFKSNVKITSAEKCDDYNVNTLKKMYNLHKTYVIERKKIGDELGVKFRLPSIPEDISENIIKFIIHKNGDKSSSWNCKGDLISTTEGIQECKCFTSDGPSSFTPTSEWDVIYFLDATKWIDNNFVLYRVNLKKTSKEWKNIKINKTETFDEQCIQKRRPRITWKELYPQIKNHCEKIFDGKFDDIFL